MGTKIVEAAIAVWIGIISVTAVYPGNPPHPNKIVENYTLILNNNGPVVIGSVIKFDAQLMLASSQAVKDKKQFLYEWHGDDEHFMQTQRAEFNTSLKRCYEFPGNHTMVVDVLYSDPFSPQYVANQTQSFLITDTLNGHILVNQDLPYKRPGTKNVFSTNHSLVLRLNLTDTFHEAPKFRFNWCYNHKDICKNTSNGELQVVYREPGDYVVSVFAGTLGKVKGCEGFREHLENMTGNFMASIRLKDPVHNVRVEGIKKIKTNQALNATVYFNGSEPFSICWKLAPVVNTSHWNQSLVCKHEIRNVNNYSIAMATTPPAGSYKFMVNVTNDISQALKSHNLTVKKPDEPPYTHSAAYVVIPVVGGLAFMTVMLAVTVYSMKYRMKRRHIETADFDFHPSLPTSPVQEEQPSLVKDWFRRVFRGDNQYSQLNSSINSRDSSRNKALKNYGSFTEST